MAVTRIARGSSRSLPGTRTAPRRLVADQLYERLKERILSGEYLPGSHLVEARLTQDHGVSRATVREALRRLLTDDLVDLAAHRGARVRQLTTDDVADLYMVREPLEGLAARLAAAASPEAQARLVEIHESGIRAVEAGDAVRFARLNASLHQAIAEITGNRALWGVLSRLNMQMVGYQFVSFANSIYYERALRDHRELLDAILASDADLAETVMRRHLVTNRDSNLRAAGSERSARLA